MLRLLPSLPVPLLLLGTALSGAAGPFVQDSAPPRWPQPHLGSIDVVREDARERNAVLAVFIVQENEEANDRFRSGVFQSEEMAKKCEELVLLLVNNGEHKPRKVKEKKDGEILEREICSAYGTPTCADHTRYFDRVFQDYNDGDALRTPQIILVLPDGKIHDRVIDEHDVGKIVKKMEKAQMKAGPSITAAELAEVKKEVSTGRSTLSQGRWVRSYQAWSRVLELVSAGEYAVEATEGLDIALEGMRGELADAMALLEDGRIALGYARLLELREAFQKSPLEKEAIQAVRNAEKNKEWKEEIEAYQREVAADELWKKIQAAVDEDKIRVAERHARRILSKYPDTKAASRVRQEFPHLVEEDGRR